MLSWMGVEDGSGRWGWGRQDSTPPEEPLQFTVAGDGKNEGGRRGAQEEVMRDAHDQILHACK